MSYLSKLTDSRSEAANHLLGTKIRDLMDKLRNGETSSSARRWIWELLQNAKDVAYNDLPVSVKVDLQHDAEGIRLLFSHNGQLFTLKNISFLIQQVSTKDQGMVDPGQKRQTGKFGTGFLSTHLLSETVYVEGILKEDGEPYLPFRVLLDRSYVELQDIIKSVEASLNTIARTVESGGHLQHVEPQAFNTTFIYLLDEESEKLAQIGIEDLHYSLPYAMAFADDIKSVIGVSDYFGYEVVVREPIENRIEKVIIQESGKNKQEKRELWVVRGESCEIAIELGVDEEGLKYIKPLQENTPRLFCVFPLIGSEVFPFPVVINSIAFNPNEPRSGIWLSNKKQPKVEENESIIQTAVQLYIQLLKYASKNSWANMYELARVKQAPDLDWLSSVWHHEHVLIPIRSALLEVPMVDTPKGRVSIADSSDGKQNVWFPVGESPEIRAGIWDLCKDWIPNVLPPVEEVEAWNGVIWQDCHHLTLQVIAKAIQDHKHLSSLSDVLQTIESETIAWLNRFYKLIEFDENFEDKIINGAYAIIPNQTGTFKKRDQLYLDVNHEIEPAVKDIAQTLGVNHWEKFVHEEVETGNRILYMPRTLQEVINEINILLKDSNISSESRNKAAATITCFFNTDNKAEIERTEIFALTSKLFSSKEYEKRTISTINKDLWKEADPIHIRQLVKYISNFNNITALALHLSLKEQETVKWLDRFVDLLRKVDMLAQVNLKQHPLLPNQHGDFRRQDELQLDDHLDEDLKKICQILGYDVKSILLDKDVFLELPQERNISNTHLAFHINDIVLQQLSKMDRDDNIKEGFQALLHYFNRFKTESEELFGDLFINKHKLYDDTEIASNLDKVVELNSIMEKHGISDMEELDAFIRNAREIQHRGAVDAVKKEVTKEMLAGWGITSEEEFEALIGKDPSDESFRHYVKPNAESYNYSQRIIKRAQENIIKYLEKLEQYDCTNWEPVADTVIGNITKNGRYINIVFRPSDNGEVLFYYPAELYTLDEDNTELWIEDGKTDPIFLTLGKILQLTKINRIPVHGIAKTYQPGN